MGKSGVEVTSPDMWGLPPTMFHKEWKSFLIHFHNFAELPTAKGRSLESPEFTFNGENWSLSLYPGGDDFDYSNDVAALFSEGCCFAGDVSSSGYVSLYLNHRSENTTTATFEVKIINKFGDTLETRRSSKYRLFDSSNSNSGWTDIVKLSDVLDKKKEILDSNGTLTVVVSIMPTPLSLSEVESTPKLASTTLDDGLPNEPSWMKQPVVVGTLSNEDVEADRADASCQTEGIECQFTHSVDPPDVYDAEESLLPNLDAWISPGGSDCRDDDEISNEGGSVTDDGGVVSINSPVTVTSPEMWGLSPTMFHKEWKSLLIHFHNFAELPTAKGHRLESPEFTCNGQTWVLRLYPGGNNSATDTGHVSLYLNHRSRGSTTATFEVKIINKYGDTLETRRSSNDRIFDSTSSNSGWTDIVKLSEVLDESKDILDSAGTLTVVVSMKNAPIPAKKAQPTVDPQRQEELKKLIVKCLLRNELLPENTGISSSGRDKVLTLQREDPSLASVGEQQEQQLPITRDPPEELYCTVRQPESQDVRTVQYPRDVLNQPPRPEPPQSSEPPQSYYPVRQPESQDVRTVQYPRDVLSKPPRPEPPQSHYSARQPGMVQYPRDVLRQPPRPEQVRYQIYSPNPQPPTSVCTAPVQNDLYSSQKSACAEMSCRSVPSQYHIIGESGLSSHAMDRRRYYKEMLLQQQLTQTQG
eukprot:scaffold7606_cov125-Skeletonema_marinoi.AAC.4